VLPDFRFDCHRCGHCCRVGHGQVWIEEQDLQPMAAAVGMSESAFLAHHVRSVDGRLSLREQPDGACVLLEGGNRCRAYESRPAQCSSFPYWPSVLDSAASLAAAALYCPGIQTLPAPQLLAPTLAAAKALLARRAMPMSAEVLEQSMRWASALEVDLVLAGGQAYAAESEADTLAVERALLTLCEQSGYPWSRGPWPRLLEDRRRAWQQHDRYPSLESKPS